jgi:hypothetical protein
VRQQSSSIFCVGSDALKVRDRGLRHNPWNPQGKDEIHAMSGAFPRRRSCFTQHDDALLRSRAAIFARPGGAVVRSLRLFRPPHKQRGAGSGRHQRVILWGRLPPPAHGDFEPSLSHSSTADETGMTPSPEAPRPPFPEFGARPPALRPTTTGSGSYCPRAIREGLPITCAAKHRSAGAAPRSALTTPHERALW